MTTPALPAGTVVLVDGTPYRLMTATLVERLPVTHSAVHQSATGIR